MAIPGKTPFHKKVQFKLYVWLLFCFDIVSRPDCANRCNPQQFRGELEMVTYNHNGQIQLDVYFHDDVTTGRFMDRNVMGSLPYVVPTIKRPLKDFTAFYEWSSLRNTHLLPPQKTIDSMITITTVEDDVLIVPFHPFSPMYAANASELSLKNYTKVQPTLNRSLSIINVRVHHLTDGEEMLRLDECWYTGSTVWSNRKERSSRDAKGQRREHGSKKREKEQAKTNDGCCNRDQQEQQQQREKEQQKQEQQHQQKQHQQQKKKLPSCTCQCHASDLIRSGKLRSSPKTCKFQLRIILSLLRTHSTTAPNTSNSTWSPPLPFSSVQQGRRCRKLLSAPWNIDATPNTKGQARRNAIRLQNEIDGLSGFQASGGGHRGVVDLLLMAEAQRHAPEEAGSGYVLCNLLVFLAWFAIWLRDQATQMVAGKKKNISFLRYLLPRPGDVPRTASMDRDSNNTPGASGTASSTSSIHQATYGFSTAGRASDREIAGMPSPTKSQRCRCNVKCTHSPSPSSETLTVYPCPSTKSPSKQKLIAMEQSKILKLSVGLSEIEVYRNIEAVLEAEVKYLKEGEEEDYNRIGAFLAPLYQMENFMAHPGQEMEYVVSPASFLPTLGAGEGDGRFLDYKGYRLASLAALPASCRLSRVRLAEAGFHYDPRANAGAVSCHRCGAAYTITSPPGLGNNDYFHLYFFL
jgi:hypothetical protein